MLCIGAVCFELELSEILQAAFCVWFLPVLFLMLICIVCSSQSSPSLSSIPGVCARARLS